MFVFSFSLVKGITGSAISGNSVLDVDASYLWILLIIIGLILIFLLWKFWDKLFFKDLLKDSSRNIPEMSSGGRNSPQDAEHRVKNESGKNAFASSNSSYARGFNP